MSGAKGPCAMVQVKIPSGPEGSSGIVCFHVPQVHPLAPNVGKVLLNRTEKRLKKQCLIW